VSEETVETDAATELFMRLNGGSGRYAALILALAPGQHLVDLIPLLEHLDLGSWSRGHIDPILARTGWPVTEDDDQLEARLGSDTDKVYCSASKTPDYMDPERWGFGEFHNLRIAQYTAPVDLENTYAQVLAACIAILGEPPLVGGPDAFAMWCRPDLTIRCSRSIRYSLVDLNIEPTEPTEGREHWEWKWGDDWQARDSWQVRPDRSRDPAGLPTWGHPEPAATTWDGLDGRLTELFVALCSDMPTHRRYVTDIVWTITSASSEGFVQGVFSTKHDTCYLERRDSSGEEVFTQTFPLTSAGGQAAAATAMVQLREIASSPEQLELSQAWASVAV
jgi:hypothetical protein